MHNSQHPEFDEVLEKARDRSAITPVRLFNLWHTAKLADKLPGCMVECGVWKGGSAYTILHATSKHLYLLDSFEGVPELTDEDICDETILSEGSFGGGDLEKQTNDLLKPYEGRYTITKGWFKDTLSLSQPKWPSLKVAFLHLDVDLYESYKTCLDFYIRYMVPGGYIICDEYGFRKLPGAKKAVDERFDVEAMTHWHTNIQLTLRMPL